MSRILVIAKRDFLALFRSPVAYVFLVVFLLLVNWFFISSLFMENAATLRSFFELLTFLMLFFLPAMTMRTFAEERRAGTLDLLLTLPVRDIDIVLGKYLAVLAFWAVTLLLTLNLPVTLAFLGNPDGGQIVAAYIGAFLAGAAILAIGLTASIFTENQIVAFVAATLIVFILLMLAHPRVLASVPSGAGAFLERLSLQSHFDGFTKGLVDLRDVYYFAAVSALALFIDVTVLESRKWR